MISESDSIHTYEFDDFFKILTADHQKFPKKLFSKGKKVEYNFKYTSNSNKYWWDHKKLKKNIS